MSIDPQFLFTMSFLHSLRRGAVLHAAVFKTVSGNQRSHAALEMRAREMSMTNAPQKAPVRGPTAPCVPASLSWMARFGLSRNERIDGHFHCNRQRTEVPNFGIFLNTTPINFGLTLWRYCSTFKATLSCESNRSFRDCTRMPCLRIVCPAFRSKLDLARRVRVLGIPS
jgi:hypothetical protein